MIFRVGDMWHRLMERLGYARFGAHGGDWGSMVTELLGRDRADVVAGIHVTDVPFYHAFQPPKDPSHDEQKYLDAIKSFTTRSVRTMTSRMRARQRGSNRR